MLGDHIPVRHEPIGTADPQHERPAWAGLDNVNDQLCAGDVQTLRASCALATLVVLELDQGTYRLAWTQQRCAVSECRV